MDYNRERQKKQSDEMFCSSCGEVIKKAAEICPKCGVRQKSSISPDGKSKIAGGLLGIFLGSFGVHKFYMGNIGLGILYLVFFWTFIPGIIGFIEGVIYLTESDERFEKRLQN